MFQLLVSAYEAEVAKRGRTAVLDEEMVSRIQKTAKWLTSSDLKFSLLLFGGYGNGKTTLVKAMKAVIESVKDIAPKCALTIEGYARKNGPISKEVKDKCESLMSIGRIPSLRIITAQEIADLSRREADEFSKIKSEPFLAIDDLGCEPAEIKSYGTAVTPVTDVFFVRYDAMLPTIITTNLDKPDIRNIYGDRVADRFNEMFELIAFKNNSYRK